jgi:outer membrane protein insertion porin family
MAGVKRVLATGACMALYALILLTVVLAGEATLATPAAAQVAVISQIAVQGNRRVEAETVRSYVTLSVGSPYDAGKADESIQNLFATGLFGDVRIERKGSSVVISVVENPVINKVVFEGNKEVEDKTLEGEVQVRPRSIFTKAKVQADVQRILDIYQKQGLFAATVEPKVIELEQNRINLVYEINEGPSTKVQSIHFVGNSAFTDAQLKEVVTTSEKSWLSWFKSTDVYDPDRLNLDRELLRQFYLKNGYADAQIVSATADLDRSGKGFYITFTVEEGDAYTFGDITVSSSLEGVNSNDLLGKATTFKGATYNVSKIEKSVEAMTLKLAGEGNAFAVVHPKPNRDNAAHTIGIDYALETGPKVYIERIDILGNVRTEDRVVRREFKLQEGDAFNRLLVTRAKERLQGLGIFKTVEISSQQGSGPDRMVLVVNVEETSTGEVSFGGGYSTSEGVIGDISYKERNLLGKGQFLSLTFSGSLTRAQIDLSFTEPRFLDSNVSAGFDVFHKETNYQASSGYKLRHSGFDVRLGFPLSDEVGLSTRYTLARDEIFDICATGGSCVVPKGVTEGATWTSAVGYTLAYDARNVKNNPTKGVYMELSQDLAGLGGDAHYLRTNAELRAYYPVMDKVTLVGRAIGGNITPWGGVDLRSSDLFYKGGETIRGFANSGYGPRDTNNNLALGGEIYYGATAEVRFPLPLVPEDLGLGGAFFADAGSLWKTSDANVAAVGGTLNDSNVLRSSVGASLTWNSPLGPLRADYAYVLSKDVNDETQAFKFGAATRF